MEQKHFDMLLQCFMGLFWFFITYVSARTMLLMTRLVLNQKRYDEAKLKWIRIVDQITDEETIQETNMEYAKILAKYENRLEKYKYGNFNDLYRYAIFFIMVILCNLAALFFAEARWSMLYGTTIVAIYQVLHILLSPLYQRFVKYQEKKELEEWTKKQQ